MSKVVLNSSPVGAYQFLLRFLWLRQKEKIMQRSVVEKKEYNHEYFVVESMCTPAAVSLRIIQVLQGNSGAKAVKISSEGEAGAERSLFVLKAII